MEPSTLRQVSPPPARPQPGIAPARARVAERTDAHRGALGSHTAASRWRGVRSRLWLVVGCAALAALVAGCGSPAENPQTIFQPTTEFADTLDDLFRLILILAAVVFVAVESVLLYTAIK